MKKVIGRAVCQTAFGWLEIYTSGSECWCGRMAGRLQPLLDGDVPAEVHYLVSCN